MFHAINELEPRGGLAAVTNPLGHVLVVGLPSGGGGAVAGRSLARQCCPTGRLSFLCLLSSFLESSTQYLELLPDLDTLR